MTEVINSISDFEKYLKNTKKVVEEALDFSLGPENPETLRESMRYSLLAGGKRIRPILCLASCSLAGGEPSLAVPTAVAIEMIHTICLCNFSYRNHGQSRCWYNPHQEPGTELRIFIFRLKFSIPDAQVPSSHLPCLGAFYLLARIWVETTLFCITSNGKQKHFLKHCSPPLRYEIILKVSITR